MIHSTDVGSLPKPKDFNEALFLKGLESVENSIFYGTDSKQQPYTYFSDVISNGLKKKLEAGIEVPCYPQYQLMDAQFKRMHKKFIESPLKNPIVEVKGRYVFNPKYTILPEIKVLKEKAPEICEKLGKEQIIIKACISDFLTLQGEVADDFIASLLAGNIVNIEHLKTQIVTLDAPSYNCRDVLNKYEKIYEIVKSVSPEVETGIHIHSSTQKDFLPVKYLDTIECHTEHIDSIKITPEELKNSHKKLQVGIAKTSDIDSVEPLDTVIKRLETSVSKFGFESIRYASPECGMGGWGSEEAAIKNLNLVAEAVNKTNEKHK